MTISQIGEKLKQIVIYAFGVLEAFLVLRLIMDLFGASKTAIFYLWIKGLTAVFYAPFEGLLPIARLPFSKSCTIDFSLLFAIGIYALSAFFALLLVDVIKGKKIG